jgi:hypothetical protein
MKIFTCLVLLATCLVVLSQDVGAQGPEMPVPNLVVKDADGKTVAQIVDTKLSESAIEGLGNSAVHSVAFNIDGDVVFFTLSSVWTGEFRNNRYLYFKSSDCSGEPHMYKQGTNLPEGATSYLIVGPDPVLGTYRVFRSTTEQASGPFRSRWQQKGDCVYDGDNNINTLNVAEELATNPLQGFHGPTTAAPERVLSIEGGTRLP